MFKKYNFEIAFALIMVAIVGFILTVFYYADQQDKRQSAACHEKPGMVYVLTRSGGHCVKGDW